jgi:hypothetical protein
LYEEKIMKLIHSTVLALVIGVAAVSSAQARDSFSLGINVGGYGYAPPPVVYYPAPVYYSEPVTYYRAAPRYYGYAPTVVSFGYTNYSHGYYGGHRHHDWDRDGDRRGRGDWSRGGRGHRDHD